MRASSAGGRRLAKTKKKVGAIPKKKRIYIEFNLNSNFVKRVIQIFWCVGYEIRVSVDNLSVFGGKLEILVCHIKLTGESYFVISI